MIPDYLVLTDYLLITVLILGFWANIRVFRESSESLQRVYSNNLLYYLL